MSDRKIPSPEVLRKLLRYEAETGKLFWLPRCVECFADEKSLEHWNTQVAGSEAFKCTDTHGYKKGTVLGGYFLAHRVIWAIIYDEWPNGQIDHINGNRLDNQIENLRLVSNAENQRNQKIAKNNSSGAIGVYPEHGKWRARITVDGKKLNLGLYDDFNDAVSARAAANIKYGFHENHGRS